MPKEYTDCVKALEAEGKPREEAQRICAIAFYKKHGMTPQEAEKMAELSYENKRSLLMAALDPNNDYRVWIRDIYDNRVIVEEGEGKLFEIQYSILDGKVTLGERKEVKVAYETLAELKDIEIFEAGTYREVEYTEDDLDTMVKNFGELKDEIQPTMVIGHSEDQKILKNSGLFAAGWLEDLRRVGKKLVADFKEVPKIVADLIEKKAYKRISSEIYKNYKEKGHALRRVALLGGQIPEVKSLQDVAALYADGEETTWVDFHEDTQSKKRKGKNKMPDLDKMQEQIDKLSETVTNLTTENADLKGKVETLEGEKSQVTAKLTEHEKAAKTSKVKGMIQPFRDAGLAAVAADGLEAFAENLDGSTVVKFGEKEQTPLDAFGEVLNGLLKKEEDGKLVVQFGEQAPGSDGERGSDEDEREKAVLKYQENHKCSYRDAVLGASREKPDLFVQE